MIVSFAHKGLEAFYLTGNKAGILPDHARRLALQLYVLERAKVPADADLPGWRLHALKGHLEGYYAITVNANWRLTFRFLPSGDVELLNYQDYH